LNAKAHELNAASAAGLSPPIKTVACGRRTGLRLALADGMKRNLLALCLAAWADSLPAQVTSRSIGHELRDMVADVGYVWGSPFRADAQDWATAALVAGTFGALLPLDRHVDRWVVAHPRSALIRVTGPFRENGGPFVRLATARRLVPISAALILAGAVSDRRPLREAGYGCLSTWAFSSSLRYAVYAVVARQRPSFAEGDPYRFAVPGGKWEHNAFFAGHATNAFGCAAFWSERFDLGVGEAALYTTAGLIAAARMSDRRHWASDTFVGVVVGIAGGRVVAGRWDRREVVRRRRAAALSGAAPYRPVVILWRGSF